MNDDAHFSLMRTLFYYVRFLCEGKIKDRKLVRNKIGSLNPPFFSNSIFRAVLWHKQFSGKTTNQFSRHFDDFQLSTTIFATYNRIHENCIKHKILTASVATQCGKP